MIQTPKFTDITSCLFVQPHPDDNEIGAGGLMCKLADMGIPVYSLTVTRGDGGSDIYAPDELAAIRQQEAQKASDILGVTYLGDLGFSNSHPGTVAEICEKIVEVMRKYKVQTIISVDPDLPNECHPVHLRVGRAVMEAFMRVNQPYYPFHSQKRHDDAYTAEILGHYFTDSDNEIIDITQQFERKMQAIRAHESQVDERFFQSLVLYNEVIAKTSPYRYAERIKLLGQVHTHCFAFPKNTDVAKLFNEALKESKPI